MYDELRPRSEPDVLKDLPLRLHHHAFVVKDQEANRHFFEDLLGLPLVATWCERTFHPDFGREVDYCHTFFGLADGGALAFFQFAEEDAYQKVRAILPPGGGWWHVALKVSAATFDELLARVKRHDVAHRVTDHGYCKSLYLTSPDGLKIEFTVDPPDIGAINTKRRKDAHTELARWLEGDHRPNNEDRGH